MAGAEVELGLPSLRSGSVESGLPVPFHFDDQVVREARFFSGTKSDFRTRVEGLAEKRNQAAAVLAPLHEAMAKRTIAMIKHQKEESARARERRELRDRELRTLFRKRVLGVQ